MKIFIIFFLVIFFTCQNIFAQTVYQVSAFDKTPEAFKALLNSNNSISTDDTLNEKILDLVNPILADSVIERKKQHHKIFGIGLLIHVFGGFNWRAVDMKKQKFVGTVIRNTRSSKERYTEYDINFDLAFHLHKYLLQQFVAFDLQKSIGKQDYRKGNYIKDYSAPPFVRDTNMIDIKMYKLHCELTPSGSFREQLNEKFYPTLHDGRDLKDHPNFGTEYPSLGFYGTWCLDCNHSCHPELHPYEWIWWLHTEEKDSTKNREWLLGLFHESSNRMKKWSTSPETGSIAIPFVIENASDTNQVLKIKIDHLVIGQFDFKKKKIKLENSFSSSEKTEAIIFMIGEKVIHAEVQFNQTLMEDAVLYYFSKLNYDSSTNMLSGYFNISTSVKDLYTSRIFFSTVQKI